MTQGHWKHTGSGWKQASKRCAARSRQACHASQAQSTNCPNPAQHISFGQGGPGSQRKMPENLRVGFWQNGFFADFYFWAAGFFRGFYRRIFFLLIFVGKVPRKILQENPRENPPKFIQQKSSDTLLQIGWGKKSG